MSLEVRARIHLLEPFREAPVIGGRVFIKGQHHAGERQDATLLELQELFLILLHPVLSLLDRIQARLIQGLQTDENHPASGRDQEVEELVIVKAVEGELGPQRPEVQLGDFLEQLLRVPDIPAEIVVVQHRQLALVEGEPGGRGETGA